jgi:hypothetical protein
VAFLAGDYAQHLRKHGELVPGWARLNGFAHGGLEALELARESTTPDRSTSWVDSAEEAWDETLRALAGLLIELVDGDPEVLSHLQHHILVRLEFELKGRADLTACELLRCTRDALSSNIAWGG